MWWMLVALVGCDEAGNESADTGETNFTTTAITDGGSYTITYTTDPTPIPADDYFSVTITAADVEGGAPLVGATAEIDAEMVSHGHGMNVTPEVIDNGDGTFTAAPFLFHMSGHWTVRFAITKDGLIEEGFFDVECCE